MARGGGSIKDGDKGDTVVGTTAVVTVGGATALTVVRHDDVAPLLAFTAAIFVALLTAYWTQRRLTQELAAANSRLATQLDAETKRQAQQLAHEIERQLNQHRHEQRRAEIDDLRSVLGDALVAAYRARETIIDNPDTRYDDDQQRRAVSAVRETETQLTKLQIRLGKKHAITSSFATMANAALALHRHRVRESVMVAREMNDPIILAWGSAYADCVRLAQERVGSGDAS
jgi:exonuclease VII large subunit